MRSLWTQSYVQALAKIIELIRKLNPHSKIVGGLNYDGVDLKLIDNLKITTSFSKINKVLGTHFKDEKIRNIFSSLGFSVDALESPDSIEVVVPSFRATKDVECEADLIEEVGRITGYDNIQAVAPSSPIFPAKISPLKVFCVKHEVFYRLLWVL